MYKQVKFRPRSEEMTLGGIWNTNTQEIICGCCGGVYNHGEIEFIKIYDDWENISDIIMGE